MRHQSFRSPLPWLALLLACCLGLLAACGGGDDANPVPGSGSLNVTIRGLPAGVAAAVTVTGPASYSKLLTASGTLDGLAPGAYAVSAASVLQGTASLVPVPATQQVQVTAGATASATGVAPGWGTNLTPPAARYPKQFWSAPMMCASRPARSQSASLSASQATG